MTAKGKGGAWLDGLLGKVTVSVAVALIVGSLGWIGIRLESLDRIEESVSAQGEFFKKDLAVYKDGIRAIETKTRVINEVFFAFLIADKPDKKALARRLAEDTQSPVYLGLDNYLDGKYAKAFESWVGAAQKGDRESQRAAEIGISKLYRDAQQTAPLNFKFEVVAGSLEKAAQATAWDSSDPSVKKFKEELAILIQAKGSAN